MAKRKPRFTVAWKENYRITSIPADTPEEAIEKAKNLIVTRRNQGESTDTYDFVASGEENNRGEQL
ncbi:MAG: hypothetical protein ACQCN4_02575 [Candidatus Bathyarchaeia archaeon]|jgi:hypothetical protein